MPNQRRNLLVFDPDDFEPLYDEDFMDADVLLDDQDLATAIGDERVRRRNKDDE